jgi:hypothetical protein
MDITELLKQVGGLQSMATELGITEAQAAQGASALAPAVLGGFKQQAQQSAGPGGLGGLVAQLGGGALLDNLTGGAPTNVGLGNQVLGQIFGSKDVSRAVAADAAATSGLDAGVLRKMLPLLGMAVAGYMGKQGGAAAPSAGGLGGLGNMLGGHMGGGGAAPGGAKAGGLAGLLDANGDGNPLDDIMRMVGKLGR